MSTSKTLERNSTEPGIKIYWKQFAAWVTGLRTKYEQDLFFRTECNVIFFQLVCTIALLIIVALAFNYLYKSITETLISSLLESVSSGTSLLTGEDILKSLSAIKTRNFIVVIAATFVITVIFGYAVARVTFTPARNALASQKRFISNIAHELRTPLAIIKTNSEVAMLDQNLPQNTQNILKSNIEELDRTSEIINNLLSLNSFVHREQIHFNMIHLGDTVDSVMKKMKKLADGKQLRISVEKKDPQSVWGNGTALEQIITNLLRNAIAYTPIGGRIAVNVEPDYRGNIMLTIKDSGIGISQKDLFHIFEPFYRAETSRSRHSGSSGLGLTIVSELIKLHSGRITIKSAPHRGTLATIMLPQNKNAPIMPTAASEADEVSVDFLERM